MKLFITFLFSLISLSLGGNLNVVASIPDIGDMLNRIGGEKVTVTVLATGQEDLHAVPARPSFLPKLHRADLLVSLGLDAEHSWLPALAAEARNPAIRENGVGWIVVSKGISILDVPKILSRSEGEQHPAGNPHFNIGPQCGLYMAQSIYDALATRSPSDTALFGHNFNIYSAEIKKAVEDLKLAAKPLKNIAIIEYHPDVAYLADFYDLRIVGSIEVKAGVPPTASHLKSLEEKARSNNVKLIVYNQSQNPKFPLKLAASLGCKAVEIANAVGAKKEIDTWIGLQKYNCNILLEGIKE